MLNFATCLWVIVHPSCLLYKCQLLIVLWITADCDWSMYRKVKLCHSKFNVFGWTVDCEVLIYWHCTAENTNYCYLAILSYPLKVLWFSFIFHYDKLYMAFVLKYMVKYMETVTWKSTLRTVFYFNTIRCLMGTALRANISISLSMKETSII